MRALPPDTHLEFQWSSHLWKIDQALPRTPATAAAVAQEIIGIKADSETIDPLDLIRAAKPASSALHKAFTWDTRKAAERWWLEQAREILYGIRIVAVTVTDEGEQRSEPVSCFASFQPTGEERGYRMVSASLTNQNHTKALLRSALLELRSFERRYQHLVELGELMTEVRRLQERLETAEA